MRLESVIDGTVWPCTVFRSRYGGVYEGGEWVAVPCYPGDSRLDPAMDEDLTCQEFFMNPPVLVGAGRTPDEAITKLTALVEASADSTRKDVDA